MLTTRGRGVLGLGLGVYLAAWGFGSKPLYPVATGLLLVVAVAWAWVRLADRPFRVRRGWGDREHGRGGDGPVVGEQGESLRRVHWRSTARRGQLMVKELEDAPRDEIAVLLDADASAVVGESFDVQVRAAGSILESYVRRGRRAVLVVNSERRDVQQVHTAAADWRRALELLAAAEPTGKAPIVRLLAEEDSPAARALELAVVTARL